MAKKQVNCSCGAAYDSNGICTRCGKKRPRSAFYRAWHGFWCVIATLLLLFCMTTTAFVRHQLKYHSLTNALRNDTKISDISVPGVGKVSALIRKEYVADENVTEEDVAEAIDAMKLPAFAADKLNAWGDMLRGSNDTVPKLQTDEIVGLLESNKAQLYRSCMLVIEDGDIADLRAGAEEPINSVNSAFDTVYGSPALRALAHFRSSGWRLLVDAVLLILILWRWAIVKRNGGKPAYAAFRSMGITVMIPSAITVLLCAGFGAVALFAKDGVVGLNPVLKSIRMPYWMSGMLGVSAAALLLIIYMLAERRQIRKALAASGEQAAVPVPNRSGYAKMDSVNVPSAPMHCVFCGKALPEGAGFCIFCGKSQSAPANPAPPAAPVNPAPAAPVDPIPAAPVNPAPTAPVDPIPAAPAAEDIPSAPDPADLLPPDDPDGSGQF